MVGGSTNYVQSDYYILGTVFRYCTLQVLPNLELELAKEVSSYLTENWGLKMLSNLCKWWGPGLNLSQVHFRTYNFNLHCLLLIITLVCWDSSPDILTNISKTNAVTLSFIIGKQVSMAETTSFWCNIFFFFSL